MPRTLWIHSTRFRFPRREAWRAWYTCPTSQALTAVTILHTCWRTLNHGSTSREMMSNVQRMVPTLTPSYTTSHTFGAVVRRYTSFFVSELRFANLCGNKCIVTCRYMHSSSRARDLSPMSLRAKECNENRELKILADSLPEQGNSVNVKYHQCQYA